MLTETKTGLYNRIASGRDELTADEVARMSEAIGKKVLDMGEFRTALRVGLYCSFGNEVRVELLFEEGDRRRKELYYPAFDPESKAASYFRVTKLSDLQPAGLGMKAPSQKLSKLRDINTLDVLIVPGVVFDLHGGRIGFANGFYDRCLEGFGGKRIALAFDFQVVAALPAAVGGRKLDWIVTEKRIIRCA